MNVAKQGTQIKIITVLVILDIITDILDHLNLFFNHLTGS